MRVEIESYGASNAQALLSRYQDASDELYEAGDPEGTVAALSSETTLAAILGAFAVAKAFLELWQQWKKTFPARQEQSESDISKLADVVEAKVAKDQTLHRSKHAQMLLTKARQLLRSDRGRTLLIAFINSAHESGM